MSFEHLETNSEEPDRPVGGVPGKWVILAIFAVSILASTAAMILIRPTSGSAPADVENRPFGPATRGEAGGAPLIYRSGDGQ